jgi:aerobic carbon-monoxide dehydrogenase large subunit
MADYAGFERRREEARARKRLRGIGFANIIEQTSQAQGETVMVRLDPGGTVTVIPGSISHGQGHETMYKILLSHRLGLDEADIRVAHSDTDLAPDGGGTYASRTAVLGGSAAMIAADKVIPVRSVPLHTSAAAPAHLPIPRAGATRPPLGWPSTAPAPTLGSALDHRGNQRRGQFPPCAPRPQGEVPPRPE